MRNAIVITLIIVFFSAASYEMSYAQGYAGTIHFHDGRAVGFNHLGTKGEVYTYTICGKMGAQIVKYNLSDIKEIIFADKTKSYGGGQFASYGAAIIVSKSDERFTIDDCYIGFNGRGISGFGGFYYVYNDPVTRKVMEATQSISGAISRVTIGPESGNSKYNPKTGEYFPPYYNYDPFTGDKLVWSERK